MLKLKTLYFLPSIYLSRLLAIITILACISIAFTPISVLTKSLFLGLIFILSTFYIARDGLLILPSSIKSIHWSTSENVMILTNQLNEQFEAYALPHTIIWPFLTVLNLKLKGRILGRSVIIFPDAVDVSVFRHWKIYFIWKSPEVPTKSII